MEFKKSLLALGVLTVLSGCGSSDDDKTPEITKPPVSETVTSDIKGVASKGTLINAPVYFYKYVDGAPVKLTEDELGSASTMTDDKGQFSAQVKVEGLVKVEIGVSQDADSPTYMICDAPVGCGQNAEDEAIAFGEQINMTVKDPTFTLTSLINAVKNDGDIQNTANITPLTHFAAALAEERGDVTAESVNKAQSEIADTFGLIGALNELVPAKVEDHASLVDGDESDDLRYALINAGIAQALFTGSEGNVGDISERLTSALTDLVAADGAFLVSRDNDDDDEFELTLEDILKGAEQATQQIIVLIKKDPELSKNLSSIADLELLVTKLNNEMSKKKADSGDDGRLKGTEIDKTEGDAVAKAAAMVNDVRIFANLFDVADTSGEEMQTQGEEFVQLVEDATMMVEEQADSFKLLGDVSEALAIIDSLRRAERITEKTVQLNDYLATPGATGVVTIDEEGLLFNVQATAGAESLSASAVIETNDTSTEYTLRIDGEIENDEAKFTLNEGTQVSILLNKAVTEDELKSGTLDFGEHDIEAIGGALNLEITLAQKKTDEVTDPVSFSGKLSAELISVSTQSLDHFYFYEQNDNGSTSSSGYRFNTRTVVMPEMITLAGGFKSEAGNELAANLTVNVANVDGYEAAGFKEAGRTVENVATMKFVNNNEAVITSVDENQSRKITLLSNGTDGTLNYEFEYQSELAGEYNGKQTFIHTQFDDAAYRFSAWGLDRGTPSGYATRIIFDNYNFAYQYAWVPGGVKSFNNGVITTYTDEEVALGDLDFYTYNRDENQGELLLHYKFVNDIESVTDLFDLFKQPEFKTILAFTNEEQGVVSVYSPTVMPDIDQSISLDGRFIRMPADNEYEVTVNEDGTQVTASINEFVESHVVTKSEQEAFTYSFSITDKEEVVESQQVSFELVNVADELKPYVLKSSKTKSNGWQENYYVLFAPSYANDKQNIVYQTYRLYPHSFDEMGQPLNEEGEVLDPKTDGETYDYSSSLHTAFDDVRYNTLSFGLYGEAPALDSFKSRIWYQGNDEHTIHRKGYGKYNIYYHRYNSNTDSDYFDSIQVNTATVVPTYFMPEDTFELEDENNFLDISAALNLDVVLGDYEVDLTLSGQRTELEQGELDLDIKYAIPGSDAQRSFTVEYDTKTETLSAKNAEGVSLEIIEPETVEGEEDAEVEIGKIMVGEEVAATILKRGSIVLIKYTGGVIESL
ncbi:hypothetical protein [Pseudoalteromonas phenolica]|uniref:Uncharacterized protein n=1 Tax=Pseudoalteromonas phenolica TaxID=161398 RepID=A0A0S2K5M6_9GAMM|nr:hypothetical protein [Pseudoalteromonas phenolica]ALO43348.1 hypothetical protein PP2015_2863 [Pseudoalteromonas phenolica]MBE0355494.1 hypothetical protein [Pseudoalteromonas phenolica O-BC30]RXF05771.1 hypothetical protein D9981_02200 [Pseudoalteromonas phenolica O-BC30]